MRKKKKYIRNARRRPAATLGLRQQYSSEFHSKVYEENASSPLPGRRASGCSSGKACPWRPTWRTEDAGSHLFWRQLLFSRHLRRVFSRLLFFTPRPCAAFPFPPGRLGDSGGEKAVKKHRSVTKPAPLRRRAQQALRLPPELRACVCLTERSRMRGVQGGLVTVCALTRPPPPARRKDIQSE